MKLDAIFSENGILAEHIPGFNVRPQQKELALAIQKTQHDNAILIAEAGTGTGKTYAYCVPAILSDKKTVISTGTKTLQDQLFHRDLPVILKALGQPKKIALLKGRANYLCLSRMHNPNIDLRFHHETVLSLHSKVLEFNTTTIDGDLTAMPGLHDDSQIWPIVTSTNDNCLGAECEFYSKCYVNKARQKALSADIVVVNHHLLFADILLKAEGVGELLPATDCFIIDEAHQLPEIASHFFGESISSRQIKLLVKDAANAASEAASDMSEFSIIEQSIGPKLDSLRVLLNAYGDKSAWHIIKDKNLQPSIMAIADDLDLFNQTLEIARDRSKELEQCYQRLQSLIHSFQKLTAKTPDDQIHCYEIYSQSFIIHHTPMDCAKAFSDCVYQPGQSWIFTSATLSVNHQFNYFAEQLGLTQYNSAKFDSPFDFQSQALLYCPRDLVDYRDSSFTQRLIQSTLPIINVLNGRTFMLFTSFRSLNESAALLKKYTHLPLLIQGEKPKARLLQEFIELNGEAILLGTMSFWEGVDVKGNMLMHVVIDKLPFASPGDPILQARFERLKRQGLQPFYAHQLPVAVIQLKQGAGRLIRDSGDRGVLSVFDPRFLAKDYARLFHQSLPNMTLTRSPELVLDFLETALHSS